jgi:hypothetical protein
MRFGLAIIVFLIIVLIAFTGCTSSHGGTANGSNSQNSVQGANVEMTTTTSIDSLINCDELPVDPIRFQRFLPDVPGYERTFGQKISWGNNYVNFTRMKKTSGYANFIADQYQISDKSNLNMVVVSFEDLGPCAGDIGLKRNILSEGQKNATRTIVNFHGYPADHTIINNYNEIYDFESIEVSNRLYVTIKAHGAPEDYSIHEAEADIEKFANAIDFKGFSESI